MLIETYSDGYAIHADSSNPNVIKNCIDLIQNDPWMLLTDPPYGNIVNEIWDKKFNEKEHAQWMLNWTNEWVKYMKPGDPIYIWGGVGTYKNRPFFIYTSQVEHEVELKIQNYITWSKKRGIGTKYNYLFTREELLFMIKGNKNTKPNVFNVPLLDELRGYDGYNENYPALSDYKRRTNVWTDVTELFRNKKHRTEKAPKVCEIPINVSSNKDYWIIDPFGGSGTTSLAARKLGRRFLTIESDPQIFELLKNRLR
jgi:site-specific DNA-methyltransferase (adenine-specific)